MKRYVIIGGGVAGLEAARVAAIRGHEPELFEMAPELGGNLIPGGAPSFKEDDLALVKWYQNEMERLHVKVTLNHKVTKEEVLEGNYDTVIVATGSTPKRFSLGDDEKVYTAAEVLTKEKSAGKKTVVIGGGLVGLETALYLREEGSEVTVVEALPKLMMLNGPLCHANSDMLKELIPYKGVNVLLDTRVEGFKDGIVSVMKGDEKIVLDADSVVLAVGYNENDSLYKSLMFDVPEIYLLGDAKKVQNIMYAIWDAFEVANHI